MPQGPPGMRPKQVEKQKAAGWRRRLWQLVGYSIVL
jgi:hypothetical protein